MNLLRVKSTVGSMLCSYTKKCNAVCDCSHRPKRRLDAAGGLGAVGSLVAKWLARHTNTHLWLLGRSGRPSADSPLPPDELEGPGSVSLARSDVSAAEEASFVVRAAHRRDSDRMQVGSIVFWH